MPLMDEEKRMCMKIDSLLPPIEKKAPMLLKEDTLEGCGFVANSLSTKEFPFKLVLPIVEVEEFILAHEKDDEGVLVMSLKVISF